MKAMMPMSKVTCMPSTAYNRTISTIRDYPRMVLELEQLKRDAGYLKATNYDGMPKAVGGASGLDDKIAVIVDMEKELEKINECIDTIPEDMRKGIMDNILYNMPFPYNEYAQLVPSLRTWQNEKRKFILLFARTMRIYPRYK